MNGKNEYCWRASEIIGNIRPTIKLPHQFATLFAAIMIGLGPTSVISITAIKYMIQFKKN